jgi:hypothetical protein
LDGWLVVVGSCQLPSWQLLPVANHACVHSLVYGQPETATLNGMHDAPHFCLHPANLGRPCCLREYCSSAGCTAPLSPSPPPCGPPGPSVPPTTTTAAVNAWAATQPPTPPSKLRSNQQKLCVQACLTIVAHAASCCSMRAIGRPATLAWLGYLDSGHRQGCPTSNPAQQLVSVTHWLISNAIKSSSTAC